MTPNNASVDLNSSRPDEIADAAFARTAVESRLEELVAYLPGVPAKLQQAVRHALLGQSKRVRPVLLYLIAEPQEWEHSAVLDAGCAVEMVHTASLILDDLPCMDDAQLRRQRPTTHVAFGQSTAILAAIALLTRAFGIIAALDQVSEDKRLSLSKLLADAVGWEGLVAGQEIDVNGRDGLSGVNEVEELNWLKTGVLFVAAAEMGAVLRGLENERLEAVRRFARHFGIAFQTADDILDSSGSAQELGKDVQMDGSKVTLVSLFGANRARLSCEEHLAHAEQALLDSGINAGPIRELMQRLFRTRQVSHP